MGKIFGIDLGTTYSCIAYLDEYGKPITLPNSENSPVTPSVVFFENADTYSVGQVAKEALNSDPDLVCSAVKRQMGTRDFTFSANGTEYQPETVSALILKKLAADASERVGEPVKDVVITCPAYFGLDAKEATKKAGEIAGLNVLAILQEPTAAAVSYGMKADGDQTILVYDLGGGTFDVTIISVKPGVIEVAATGGDHHLGGKDWDEAVTNYIVDQYCLATGANPDSIYEDSIQLGDLELKSENAKKQLSQRDSTAIRFEGERIELSREQFNAMTAALLQNTIDKTRETLDDAAKKGITKIDKILLVGGSTKMPQIKERLAQEFPTTPIEVHDPDESVAKGAAIFGANLAEWLELTKGGTVPPPTGGKRGFGLGPGNEPKMPMEIRNVVSKSYGIRFQGDDGQPHVYNQIYRQSTIPLELPVSAFTVADNQERVFIEIFENDYKQDQDPENIVPDDACTPLVSDYLEPLPPKLPKGSPISILLKIDGQGFMTIDCRDETGGRTVHMEVQLQNVMSEEMIQEARSQVMGMRMG